MSNNQNIINALISSIQEVIDENGEGLITGPVLQDVLVEMVSQINAIIITPEDFLLNQYPAYDPEETYTGGNQVIVKHNGLLWLFLSETDKTGVTPGTNASVWEQFNGLSLAHAKNKDTKLDEGGTYEMTAQFIYEAIANFDPGETISSTDDLEEGSNNKYFTAARVRATFLTGLSISVATAIGASDSVLSALGKLQAQINSLPAVPGSTTNLTEGSNLYFTAARVLATVIAGYAAGANEALADTDTVLAALGKLQGQINALASASGITETQLKDTARTFNSAQRMKWVALTHDTIVTADFALGNNFTITSAGNFTMANPSNLAAGQSGVIEVVMGGIGDFTIAWGDKWYSDQSEEDMQPSGTTGDITEYGYTVNSDATRISLYKRGPLNQITV